MINSIAPQSPAIYAASPPPLEFGLSHFVFAAAATSLQSPQFEEESESQTPRLFSPPSSPSPGPRPQGPTPVEIPSPPPLLSAQSIGLLGRIEAPAVGTLLPLRQQLPQALLHGVACKMITFIPKKIPLAARDIVLWTPDEDKKLLKVRKAHRKYSWDRIAILVGTHNKDECSTRWKILAKKIGAN